MTVDGGADGGGGEPSAGDEHEGGEDHRKNHLHRVRSKKILLVWKHDKCTCIRKLFQSRLLDCSLLLDVGQADSHMLCPWLGVN